MKKKLVFYFYITPDFLQRKTNLCHIECLRRYANIFDEAEFILSLDDIHDLEMIHSVENILISLPFNGNISFKIHQNDKFRESIVIKEEVFDKLKDMNRLVFFGHGKGFTNLDIYEETSMLHWLLGCYYLSLNFMDEVVNMIDSNDKTWLAYGSFPLVQKRPATLESLSNKDDIYLGRIKYQWCYSGTFFWINTPKLRDIMRIYDIEEPQIFDRYYSEKYLGNVIPYSNNGTAHKNIYLFGNNNMYNDGIAEDCLRFILGDEMNEYYKFYNSILEDIKKWEK